jgi:PAS domain S-box-containing protein
MMEQQPRQPSAAAGPGDRNSIALHLRAEQFQLLVESVRDYAIYMLDPEGYVISWNAGAERLKGYRAEEIIGQHFSRFYPPEEVQRGRPQAELRTAAAEGRAEDESWRVRKDGSRFWAYVVVSAMYDPSGQLCGFAKVTRDLSESKQAEDALKEYAIRLEQSNRELQEFATVASHDLQEPLRKIQAFGDLLKEECGPALNADGREYLGLMQDAARRMQSLIQALLSLSRVTTRGQPFVPVDLSAIAREAVMDLEMRLRQTGGRVEIDSLPDIEADPMQMRQLFQNLIGNALKFHRAEEPPVVRVSGQLVDEPNAGPDGAVSFGQIRVEDNGIGFDEKYLDRIFAPFQRLHTSADYEGTGMGLAICRRIVERHAGRITAGSMLGRGSCFVLDLPVCQRSSSR